jgi:hypothetical protein
MSVAKDSGLHPLVPYFSYFITDEVYIVLFYVSFYYFLVFVC